MTVQLPTKGAQRGARELIDENGFLRSMSSNLSALVATSEKRFRLGAHA